MIGVGPSELLLVAFVLLAAQIVRSREPLRFSVRDLFIATTVIAVVLGLACVMMR